MIISGFENLYLCINYIIVCTVMLIFLSLYYQNFIRTISGSSFYCCFHMTSDYDCDKSALLFVSHHSSWR